jgi:4-hydroxy-3-methylbut-2-enyl diphosphate reductase IspH
VSKGFDPDTMLQKVGLANQTTMYKKETRAIGQLLQKAMMKKYGPVEAQKHYMEFDTICDATQVRGQDWAESFGQLRMESLRSQSYLLLTVSVPVNTT